MVLAHEKLGPGDTNLPAIIDTASALLAKIALLVNETNVAIKHYSYLSIGGNM